MQTISDLEMQENRHNWFDFMKPEKKQNKPQLQQG